MGVSEGLAVPFFEIYPMRIYRIATSSDSKKIKDLEKDLKAVKRDLDKLSKQIKDLNIGQRRYWQHISPVTSLQRKMERLEKLEQEWKEFKKGLLTDVKKEIEKRTRAQVKG